MENEKIIAKIKKLFELSKNNPSKEEAESAALKAQELLAQYHIDFAEVEEMTLDKAEAIEEIHVNVPAKKWKYTLASIVARNFRCRHFYYGKGIVVFYGHKTDATIASETFKYLFTVGDKMANKTARLVRQKTCEAGGVYNSFIMGFCTGIKEVLEEQSKALMVLVPEDVESGFDAIAKVSRSMHARRPSVTNAAHYFAGVAAGKDAVRGRRLEA